MSKKLTFCGFMVPVDIILDSRMGTIAKMDMELASNIDPEAYRTRLNDQFGTITREAFKEAYALRDTDTLSLSIATAFIPVLRRIIQEMAMGDGKDFHPEMPKLYINTYPYLFTDEEISELGLIVTNLINTEHVELEIIHKSLEELTPEYCLANFRFMAMYMEYNAWLDHHRFALHKTKMEHIVLFAPAMFDHDIPTPERMRETLETVGMHPIEMHEQTAKELIDLNLIDIKYFSLVDLETSVMGETPVVLS